MLGLSMVQLLVQQPTTYLAHLIVRLSNPAEKLNTQYKTWEFQLYIFGLAPALLHTILPQDIWLNFCKLVRGIRIVCQHSISQNELREAQLLLGEWETEFEQLYYQRRHDHIHFIRPCVHQVNHLIRETIRKALQCVMHSGRWNGPLATLDQQIRQPSNPYANLSMEAVRRCQANALKSILPFLAPPDNVLPRGHQELGNGYVLLRIREKRPYRPPAIHVALLEDFVHAPLPQMHRWARLRLPCGQIACTAWRESERPLEKLRIARHIKVIIDGTVRFAEVQYFTQVAIATENIGEWRDANIAVISVFSAPDADLVQLSNQTVLSCKYLGNEGLCVVDVTSIKSVVSMIPAPSYSTIWSHRGSLFCS
ncbi:hypothetical protein DFJ58DRAFT_750346 [Suillus subalutaceus]|uniref:uncharacterized protein n=1 Tax=Suillus subalutaceus TaxID=48586 RepID=UPI001B864FC5|nr:uncharacterized protein DFJ58DRAFT_750346 [Suillus subalutaceus]KAG1832624.1 hypothetical protein DFJ58DRAFT_750346 [Suillus subalutaceus]